MFISASSLRATAACVLFVACACREVAQKDVRGRIRPCDAEDWAWLARNGVPIRPLPPIELEGGQSRLVARVVHVGYRIRWVNLWQTSDGFALEQPWDSEPELVIVSKELGALVRPTWARYLRELSDPSAHSGELDGEGSYLISIIDTDESELCGWVWRERPGHLTSPLVGSANRLLGLTESSYDQERERLVIEVFAALGREFEKQASDRR